MHCVHHLHLVALPLSLLLTTSFSCSPPSGSLPPTVRRQSSFFYRSASTSLIKKKYPGTLDHTAQPEKHSQSPISSPRISAYHLLGCLPTLLQLNFSSGILDTPARSSAARSRASSRTAPGSLELGKTKAGHGNPLHLERFASCWITLFWPLLPLLPWSTLCHTTFCHTPLQPLF